MAPSQPPMAPSRLSESASDGSVSPIRVSLRWLRVAYPSQPPMALGRLSQSASDGSESLVPGDGAGMGQALDTAGVAPRTDLLTIGMREGERERERERE